VLWFSDLRGFTRITQAVAPQEVIPFLNDYADAIISSVQESGGDVLKLIGDGTLAIFKAEDPGTACESALKAEALMRSRIDAVNATRSVVGPAVNEASRIAALCRSVERDLLLSSSFAAASPAEDRVRFISVGRYLLRGVDRAQELFTLERI
jgi:adenylate cyclase